MLLRADQERQILGHFAAFHRGDADLFQLLGEGLDLGRAVDLGAVGEAAGPGEDRGDRVGRGFLTLLMLAVMAGHRAVRRFRLDRLAIGRHQHRRHQAERAEALGDGVALDVAIIILASPDEAAAPFHRGRHHIVDQAVLVGDVLFREFLLEFVVKHLLKQILETPVIGLEDRVLRGEIDGVAAHQSVVKRRACEIADRIVPIVHAERHA